MYKPLFILLLSGCAVVGHNKVEGWPALRIIEHHVSNAQVLERCSKYAVAPMGCAEFYLSSGECHIYVSSEFPDQGVLEHERLHCQGHDHVGSIAMRDMLGRWKAR